MTNFIAWVQHLPLYAQAAALAGILAGLVKFGGDLLKLLQSWRDLKKPKEQPTLNDVRKVERIVLKPTSSHTKRNVAMGAMLGMGGMAAGELLEHSHHIEPISHSVSAVADLPAEHLASIADMHPVAEHAHGLWEILSNIFEALS